jgi:hypothetical protein
VTTAAAIVSSLLPRPIDSLITIPLFAVGVFLLVILLKQSIRLSVRTSSEIKGILRQARYVIPLAGGVVISGFAILGGTVILSDHGADPALDMKAPLVFVLVFLFVGLCSSFIGYREYRSSRQENSAGIAEPGSDSRTLSDNECTQPPQHRLPGRDAPH